MFLKNVNWVYRNSGTLVQCRGHWYNVVFSTQFACLKYSW